MNLVILSHGNKLLGDCFPERDAVDQKIGKYTLVQRLGGGGMAEVFKARFHGPAGFEKDVALKLILPHYLDDAEFIKMFIHEATLAARLDHANIVRIYEFDAIEGRYYIAMELVDGSDLRKLLACSRDAGIPLTIPQSLIIALEVCKGLAFAHGELTPGSPVVIHRDISPHNIIVSRAGEVKITDFGIAKLASTTGMTATGVIKGKAAYMSPEQASARELDKSSDLFSLGCVLWEMLTGRRLFSGDNDLAVLEQLKSAPIPVPSTFNASIPSELDALVMKVLERDRELRLQSASELARLLDSLLLACTDLDRPRTLVGLVQELSDRLPRRRGTAVLSVPDPEPMGEPSLPAADAFPPVEPVGPHVDTWREAMFPTEQEPVPPLSTQPGEPDTESGSGFTRERAERVGKGWLIAILAAMGIAVVLWFLPTPQAEPEPLVIAPNADGRSVVEASRAAPVPASEQQRADPAQDATGLEPEQKTPEMDEHTGPSESGPAVAHAQEIPPPAGRKVTRSGSKNARPAAMGRLKLYARPWAKVYFKNRYLGETPLENLPFPVGKHRLVFKHPEHRTEVVVVEVRANQETVHVVQMR